MNKTKYIFFGTPTFAALILKRLIASGITPVAVVTNPDRPLGRKKIITPPPIKTYIMNQAVGIRDQITVVQPEDLKTITHELKDLHPEIGIVAAYGKIIPHEIIDVFPRGIVATHPSLLPHYRGATPIQSTLLNGDAETGTTVFLMDEKMDHGPIIGYKKVGIMYDDTYETLLIKLAEASADVLIEILPRFMRGDIILKAQDEAQATYTKKLIGTDGFADLQKDVPEKIGRMVRALNPEPGVWCIHNGRRMKILEADVIDGKLVLKKIQFDGEKPRAA